MNKSDYERAFEEERVREYPAIDAVEAECGHAVDMAWLENAARVLACPVKRNPPNWQHGRVIYSSYRRYLDRTPAGVAIVALDIGTAKGFSAIVAARALLDAGREFRLYSVDVIDPAARVFRNTVAELDGALTLFETVSPWPESRHVQFLQAQGVNWLMMHRGVIDLAFVDGKHVQSVVSAELLLLAQRQRPGSVVLLDDIQYPGVRSACDACETHQFRLVEASAQRVYALGQRV